MDGVVGQHRSFLHTGGIENVPVAVLLLDVYVSFLFFGSLPQVESVWSVSVLTAESLLGPALTGHSNVCSYVAEPSLWP